MGKPDYFELKAINKFEIMSYVASTGKTPHRPSLLEHSKYDGRYRRRERGPIDPRAD